MSHLIAELKRRNVIRVVIAYLAGAWLLVQLFDTLFPIYGIPDSALQVLTTLLGIGLIPVIILTWVFELTPEGLKRDVDIPRNEAIAAQTGKTLNRVIVVVLVLAVGFFAVDKFVLDPARDAKMAEQVAAQARKEALVESFGDKSIAVLPFTNMSSDPEQEYFADGIAEELLNLLASIGDLRVISRTSAFQFKGSDLSLIEIGDKLDVAHILEGSVRMSGHQIRITAQLIDARTDNHIWSQTFDRRMEDIFAIQDEVAAQVVEQLKVKLSVGLNPVTRHNPEAYPLYLKAKQLMNSYESAHLQRAQELLNKALEIDPDYANAKVELGWVYDGIADEAYYSSDFDLAEQLWERQDNMLSEVAAVDPDNVQLNIARAWIHIAEPNVAAPYIERALGRDPNSIRALNVAMVLMTRLWRDPIAQRIGEYLVNRDPLNPAVLWNLSRVQLNNGAFKLAEKTARTRSALTPGRYGSQWHLGVALLFQGRPDAALAQFQSIPLDYDRAFHLQGTAVALHALGRHEESAAALAALVDRENAVPEPELRWYLAIAITYAFIGDADRAFHYLEEARKSSPGHLRVFARNPFYSSIEDDPRWIPFLESAGLAPDQLGGVEFNPRLPAAIVAQDVTR